MAAAPTTRTETEEEGEAVPVAAQITQGLPGLPLFIQLIQLMAQHPADYLRTPPDRIELCLWLLAEGVDVSVLVRLTGHVDATVTRWLLRAAEQIRTCVCYARTNVRLAAGYAGVSDFKDGPTHHAILDLAIMRVMPEMTVIVPADATEAGKWMPVVAEYDGPVYLRLSRAATPPLHDESLRVEIGKGLTLREGNDLTLIGAGSTVSRSLAAAEELAKEGIDARVLEIHTIKPLDVDLVLQAAEEPGAIVTAEEHSVIGGLGGAVAEALAGALPTPLEQVGIADTFTRTALNPESLMDACGLAVMDSVAAARQALARK